MNKVLLVITTESNEKKAKKIAKILIKNKLAACVSMKNIYSIYKWEGVIEDNKEVEMTIKTKPELKDDLMFFLQKVTSYDLPQILYKEFYTEQKYHDWLTKNI